MELQEEANVFEVNCTLDHLTCSVVGYFTHPQLKPGYHGLVAALSIPAKTDKPQLQPRVITKSYRNGTPRVPTPRGYWAAIAAAEAILLRERRLDLYYFNAVTGDPVAAPKLECVPYEKAE